MLKRVTKNTSVDDLDRFHQELERYADELHHELEKLNRETDYITANAWKGEQANQFRNVLATNTEDIEKNIVKLRDLSEKIRKAAADLRAAEARKLGKR